MLGLGTALLLVLAGCTRPVGSFSLLTTGSPDWSRINNAPVVNNVEASDGRFWFLFIPFDNAPNLGEAVQRAIAGKGDYMQRVSVLETGWTFFGLVSYGSFQVKGDVGNTKAAATDTRGNTIIIKSDSDTTTITP